jgi:hypothetical protein
MLVRKAQKTQALHSEYAVQVQDLVPSDVPREISKYYSSPWKIECRILYKNARRTRTQWVFRDTGKITLFVASIGEDGAGFLEWYNENGTVIEEQRLNADGSGLFISYTYSDMFLLKAEAHAVEAVIKPQPKEPVAETETLPAAAPTSPPLPVDVLPADGEEAPAGIDAPVSESESEGEREIELELSFDDIKPPAPVDKTPEEPPVTPQALLVRNPQGAAAIPDFYVAVTGREAGPLWTDNYRYTRTNMIRAIERNYTAPAGTRGAERISFPRFVLNSRNDKEFIAPGNSLSSNFLLDTFAGADRGTTQAIYTLDSRQRILSEVRRDEEGNVIGELTNIWKNDRIEQVTWQGKDDERIIRFSYNKGGDRIGEKDYRNGILERTVEGTGGDEVETLYLNDKPLLRAIWKDGKKISEERISNMQTRRHETQ